MIDIGYVSGDGRPIVTIDNAIGHMMQSELLKLASYSEYRIGWEDNRLLNQKHDFHLHCSLPTDHSLLLSLKDTIFNLKELEEYFSELDKWTLDQAVINLDTFATTHYIHSHPEYRLVLLYYVNMEWPPGSYGETNFYTDDTEQLKFVSQYTPARVILFDGTIPHAIRPQSINGPQYRWTLSMFFN